MSNRSVPVVIGDTTVRVNVQGARGEEEVALKLGGLDEVMDGIKAMATRLQSVLVAVAPTKACVEFSVDLTIDAGKVVALFFNSGGTAGLKVSLEWERRDETPAAPRA